MQDSVARRRTPELRRLLSVVMVLALGAAGVAVIATLPKLGSPAAPVTPSASSNPWLAPSGVARAQGLRASFGLRYEDSWVRFVATDPQSLANVGKYSIPMTDAEVADLGARLADQQTVLGDLEQFANAHSGAWGGDYLNGDQIVVLLLDPTGAVEKELRTVVPAQFMVKQARNRLAELNDVSTRVSADPWLLSHYHTISAGVDVEHNTVALEVSSADQSVPATIADHFKLGDKLSISIDGSGAALLPKGNVIGRAVDASGKAAAGLDIQLVPDIPGVDTGEVGRQTSADGSFEIVGIAATGYQIRLVVGPATTGHPEASQKTLVGAARVKVTANKTTSVTIVVTWP
jgi:hypothetical protein